MKGGILSIVIAAPLVKPQTMPTTMAPRRARAVGNCAAITMAPHTPASPTIEPTERSIPPAAMTIVMPMAMMVMTVVWRRTEERLFTVKK